MQPLFFYNADVFLMYTLISSVYLYKITEFGVDWGYLSIILGANILAVIGVYLLNKITDEEEDSANGVVGKMRKRLVFSVITIFFIAAFLLYTIPKKENLLWYGFLLFLLGVWYSFPRRYRLKNIFLVKNIVPAFCWFFSLAILIFSSTDSLSMGQIVSFLWLFGVLVFVFEILWDIPDRKGDRDAGILTLPVILGTGVTKILLGGCLIIIIFLTDSLPIRSVAFLLLGFVIFVADEYGKRQYRYFLFFLSAFVIGVNVLDVFKNTVAVRETEQMKPVSPQDVLIYEYTVGKLSLNASGKTEYSWEPAVSYETSLEKTDDEKQIYHIEKLENNIVFDPSTFTSAEIWKDTPFVYVFEKNQRKPERFVAGTAWSGSYIMSPRKGSPCAEYNVYINYRNLLQDKYVIPVVIDGEKHTAESVLVKQSSTWSHCTVNGTGFSNFRYSPDLGVLVFFEGIIYHEGILYRGARVELKEIRRYNEKE